MKNRQELQRQSIKYYKEKNRLDQQTIQNKLDSQLNYYHDRINMLKLNMKKEKEDQELLQKSLNQVHQSI